MGLMNGMRRRLGCCTGRRLHKVNKTGKEIMRNTFLFITMLILAFPVWGTAKEGFETARIPSLTSSLKVSSPIDFCGERVPIEEQRVKERFEKAFMYSIQDRAQVLLWIKRSGRYMPHIEKILKKNNMPDDLKYITIVESALRPNIRSSKGATGFWQFMGLTGKRYGLTINRKIDERRNIFKSTDAAVLYLQELYAEFNSWTLAAAAYNMGEDRLREDIINQETNDFYKLHLYRETQHYIFKIVSVKLVLSNPGKYGFFLDKGDLYPPLTFDHVKIKSSKEIPLVVVARAAGTYYKTIREMNPEIRSNRLNRGSYVVAVPAGTGKGFAERYKAEHTAWTAENTPGGKQAASYNFNNRMETASDNVISYPYTIHVISFQDRQRTLNEAKELKSNGVPVLTSLTSIPDKGEWWRIFIGYFSDYREARMAAAYLEQQSFSYAKVVKFPYAVQVGLYKTELEVQETGNALQEKGYFTYSIPDRKEKDKNRLLVGAFRTEKEADWFITRLKGDGFGGKPVVR